MIGTEAHTPAPVEKRKAQAGGESALNVERHHLNGEAGSRGALSLERLLQAVA